MFKTINSKWRQLSGVATKIFHSYKGTVHALVLFSFMVSSFFFFFCKNKIPAMTWNPNGGENVKKKTSSVFIKANSNKKKDVKLEKCKRKKSNQQTKEKTGWAEWSGGRRLKKNEKEKKMVISWCSVSCGERRERGRVHICKTDRERNWGGHDRGGWHRRTEGQRDGQREAAQVWDRTSQDRTGVPPPPSLPGCTLSVVSTLHQRALCVNGSGRISAPHALTCC